MSTSRDAREREIRLMRELFINGFEETRPFKTSRGIEVPLDKMLNAGKWRLNLTPCTLVASRNKQNSLSMDRAPVENNPGIFIIWMLRNPLDILTSTHPDKPGGFYVSYQRLTASIDLYNEFKDFPRVLTVRCEDLVNNPDLVQSRLAEKIGLKTRSAFTECHKKFNASKQTVRALKGVRQVNPGSVNKWKSDPVIKEYIQGLFQECPDLPHQMQHLNYSIPEEVFNN